MKKIKRFTIITVLLAVISLTVSFKPDFFEVAKQIEIYTSAFKELNKYYIDEVNPSQLTSNSLNKMLEGLDPYTKYYDEQLVEDAKIRSRGAYGGIGANSSFKEKKLIVREVYQDTPASKSGLQAGDEIIKIDNIVVKDFQGKAIHSLMQGLPDTKVNLTIKRDNQILVKEITRATIEIDPIPFYKMIDKEVGYMAFIKFNKKASKRVKEAYDDLKDQGMKKLIIDVRGNPGGLLNEVVKIVNYFVKKDQIVVTTKAKVKKWSSTYKTKQEPLDLEIPLVILINEKSASASEILSGALQDLDRAVVIGERSYGKGLVQRTRKLPYGTQIKLTIAKYYTPSGRCIQELDYTNRDKKTGIVPKFNQKKRNMFKTNNGRKVYDGGGVEPDITIEKPKKSIATKALFTSDAIFKFSVNYIKTHPNIAKAEDFLLSETDYKNFTNFIQSNETSFKTKTEKEFEKAFKKAKEEKMDNVLINSYKQLQDNLTAKKISELEINKLEILTKISDEILKQKYFKKGMYVNKFTHDKIIQKATALLNNTKKYNKILN